MARFVIKDDSGRNITVDDYRTVGNGEIEYIEPYTHDVKRVKGTYHRDAVGGERGIFHGLFQGPKFNK